MRLARLAALLFSSCLAGQACARAQARGPAELPPLDVPVAPPRVMAPANVPLPPAPAELPESSTPAQPTRPATRPPRPDAPARTEPSPQVPTREERSAEPALQIRAPRSGSDEEAERQIRDLIRRAGEALSRVNYAALDTDARTHYDTAKRFVEQAAEAVKVKNFVFAKYLADKADTLARELSGR